LLSIIIPTYNRNDVFYKTLSSAYEAIQGIDAEIIVINDSPTNEVVIDARYKKHVQYFRNTKKGVASARNMGASKAKGELFLFVDDDINLEKSNLDYVLSFFEHQNPDKHICLNLNWAYPPSLLAMAQQSQFGRFLYHYGFTSLKGWMNNTGWFENTLINKGSFSSFFVMMQKKTYHLIGGYNEAIPFGFEDYDFSYRAGKIKEIDIYLDTRNTVLHNEFDRLELKNWLQRKKLESYGRTVGFTIATGEETQMIRYSKSQQTIFQILLKVKPLIIGISKLIPNFKIFDVFYFPIIKTLLGVAMFEGFLMYQKEPSKA
jgi:glycosyltransferase involved in cell wall biosynthesis